jgi:hypothetical protein
MDDALELRLRALGDSPVEPDLQDRHLAAMAAVGAGAAAGRGRGRWRFTWRAVAAAGIVGFLGGSTGLAAAGSLPDPAQDVAHDVLGAVGIDVPRSSEGCPAGRTYRNHGEYVAEVEAAGGDVEAAARSDCGKPERGGGNGNGRGNGNGGASGAPRPDTDGDPCTGAPPWAGAHLPREQRDALQAEHRALCGDDATDELEESQSAPAGESDVDETSTTTVPEETTTTVAEDTTTTAPDETTTSTGG